MLMGIVSLNPITSLPKKSKAFNKPVENMPLTALTFFIMTLRIKNIKDTDSRKIKYLRWITILRILLILFFILKFNELFY